MRKKERRERGRDREEVEKRKWKRGSENWERYVLYCREWVGKKEEKGGEIERSGTGR